MPELLPGQRVADDRGRVYRVETIDADRGVVLADGRSFWLQDVQRMTFIGDPLPEWLRVGRSLTVAVPGTVLGHNPREPFLANGIIAGIHEFEVTIRVDDKTFRLPIPELTGETIWPIGSYVRCAGRYLIVGHELGGIHLAHPLNSEVSAVSVKLKPGQGSWFLDATPTDEPPPWLKLGETIWRTVSTKIPEPYIVREILREWKVFHADRVNGGGGVRYVPFDAMVDWKIRALTRFDREPLL